MQAVTDHSHRVSRRRALAGGAAVAGTLAAGCAGRDDDSVSVLAAGSLQRALDVRFREEVDVDLSVETRGSAACARLVAEGLREPDLLVLADPVLFEGLADRYTAFAANSLVVAHAGTPVGRRVGDAPVPLDPLFADEARLARTDPDADPLGYRTLFALALAAERWEREYPALLSPDQLVPETELLALVETGSVDAAVAYRNMAVDHGVSFRPLPPRVNLAVPRLADHYATQSYELPSGQVVRGKPITYGAALLGERPATGAVFEALVAGDWLGGSFRVPESLPVVREP